ncbi:MAG: CRISPR-associated protein [Marinifilaceae bacterium]
MFINLSNHNSAKWGAAQREAAQSYGKIYDLPFPHIDPAASEADVEQLARDQLEEINQLMAANNEKSAVHIMGEFTFCFALVTLLKAEGITCVSSTTQRIVKENSKEKISIFNFIKFRRY